MDNKELDMVLEELNAVNYIDLINEAYIGKTPTLIEAEQQLGVIRSNLNMYRVDNSAPDILKFNRLIEKQFGMDLFGLKIIPTSDINATTLDIGLRFDMIGKDMQKFVVGNKDTGYKFAKNNNICVIIEISSGLLKANYLTDADCMAIILHELGHNFADCIYDDIILYNQEMMTAYRDSIIAGSIFKGTAEYTMKNKYNSENDMKVEKKSQKKRSNRIITFLKSIDSKIDDELYNWLDRLNRRSKFGSQGIKYYKSSITSEDKENNRVSIHRQHEVFADKFPTIYGYGPNLSAALLAIDRPYNKPNYAIVANDKNERHRINNFKYQSEFMTLLDDEEHPHTIQRLNNILTTMEAEYKKENIDPRIKEEIVKQIKEVKKQLKDETDALTKMKNIDKAQANFYAYVNKSCPDATTKEINDKIEEALDKKLEEIDKKK